MNSGHGSLLYFYPGFLQLNFREIPFYTNISQIAESWLLRFLMRPLNVIRENAICDSSCFSVGKTRGLNLSLVLRVERLLRERVLRPWPGSGTAMHILSLVIGVKRCLELALSLIHI